MVNWLASGVTDAVVGRGHSLTYCAPKTDGMTDQHLVVQADVIRTIWACSELEYALGLMLCMPSQHYAIGLQSDCMVVVPAPLVRLPDSHVYAPWP